jgi:hypothetical protein
MYKFLLKPILEDHVMLAMLPVNTLYVAAGAPLIARLAVVLKTTWLEETPVPTCEPAPKPPTFVAKSVKLAFKALKVVE